MIKSRYAREKFYNAIRTLAVGHGDVRSRLKHAYLYNLIHIREEHLPEKFHKDLNWIKKKMTSKGPYLGTDNRIIKGSVKWTMSCIRNTTGGKIADKIFDIWAGLES
jgi:hypothetical protein